jgi:hypothetical protein
MRETSLKSLRKRRATVIITAMITLLVVVFTPLLREDTPQVAPDTAQTDVLSESVVGGELALDVLDKLEVKGRAPKTGYKRSEFGSGWADILGCDMRNRMLREGMIEFKLADDGCIVLSGTLVDPYTGKTILFTRGTTTSDDVQIDHVVALSDAWQKGAQALSFEQRVQFANDPLNLLAVDGPANQEKGDGDAATWLPPDKSFRCRYVARQIAVKRQYNLWVTEAEKSAMKRILNGCESQVLPDIK